MKKLKNQAQRSVFFGLIPWRSHPSWKHAIPSGIFPDTSLQEKRHPRPSRGFPTPKQRSRRSLKNVQSIFASYKALFCLFYVTCYLSIYDSISAKFFTQGTNHNHVRERLEFKKNASKIQDSFSRMTNINFSEIIFNNFQIIIFSYLSHPSYRTICPITPTGVIVQTGRETGPETGERHGRAPSVSPYL